MMDGDPVYYLCGLTSDGLTFYQTMSREEADDIANRNPAVFEVSAEEFARRYNRWLERYLSDDNSVSSHDEGDQRLIAVISELLQQIEWYTHVDDKASGGTKYVCDVCGGEGPYKKHRESGLDHVAGIKHKEGCPVDRALRAMEKEYYTDR